MAKSRKSKQKSKQIEMDFSEGKNSLEILKIKKIRGKVYQKINAKIKKLNKEKESVEELKNRISSINNEYKKRILPLLELYNKEHENMLVLLDKFRKKKTVSKHYKSLAEEEMNSLISYFSERGYMTPVVSKLEQELRPKLEDIIDDHEEKIVKELFEAMAADMFEDLGIEAELNFEDFKNLSVEEIRDKIQQQIFKRLKENQERERIELQKEKQSYNDDTFKKMYKTLAKVLHPDKTNTIENKEELMKELSSAWEERNYLKLLEINALVNPDGEEIVLDNKHLKELERDLIKELESIQEFKLAVKDCLTEEFGIYYDFYHVLNSKREEKFRIEEEKIKSEIEKIKELNKINFKSIKSTKKFLDENYSEKLEEDEFFDFLIDNIDSI